MMDDPELLVDVLVLFVVTARKIWPIMDGSLG